MSQPRSGWKLQRGKRVLKGHRKPSLSTGDFQQTLAFGLIGETVIHPYFPSVAEGDFLTKARMKVVVQHSITHFYLTPSNEWKPGIEDARLFHSACDAVTHSFRHIQPPYNVVLKFDEPQYDFALLTSDDLNNATAPIFASKPNGSSEEGINSIAQMQERCREMSLSSKILINETHTLIAASRKVLAGSKKSIAAVRRDNRRARNGTR